MSSGMLKTACLSVGLASAWAPCADAEIMTRVHFQTELVGDVSHALVFLGSIGSGGFAEGIFLRDLSLPGMGSGSIASEFDVRAFGTNFALIGVTGGSINPRLVVSTGGGSGLVGMTFEEAFPGYSETALIAQLFNNDPAADDFLRANFTSLSYLQGLLNNVAAFSVGEPYGAVLFQAVAVPAPASIGVLGLGVLTLRRRRR